MRVACSREIGTGHLRRCITLAREVVAAGLDAVLCVDDDPVARRIIEGVQDVAVRFVDPETSLASCADGASIVVLDLPSALVDPERDRALRRDIAELDRAGAAVVSLGHSVSDSGHLRAVIDLYPATQIAAVNYLEGPEFLILRGEFGKRRQAPPEEDRILVAMGGTDPLDLTGLALGALASSGSQASIDVVLGAGYRFLPDDVRRRARELGLDVEVHVEVPAGPLAELMSACRAGVVAFGTTAYELMALGVPVLAFTHYAWQAPSARFFEGLGALQYLGGGHDALEAQAVGRDIAQVVGDDARLSRMAERGAEVVDGAGARRVVQLLEGFAGETEERTLDHLYVLAHPGDEVFGCGGTIVNQTRAGERVGLVVLGEGTASRQEGVEDASTVRAQQTDLTSALQRVTDGLGIAALYYFRYADNRFDGHDLLDLIKTVEIVVERHRPRAVYTHHPGDLNVDHRLTFEAVATAVRPAPDSPVRRLFSVEVPSSSDWGNILARAAFAPNWFVDVAETLDVKLDLAAAYTSEVRPAPHPRSLDGLRARAALWGHMSGLEMAEAFVLHRHIDGGQRDPSA